MTTYTNWAMVEWLSILLFEGKELDPHVQPLLPIYSTLKHSFREFTWLRLLPRGDMISLLHPHKSTCYYRSWCLSRRPTKILLLCLYADHVISHTWHKEVNKYAFILLNICIRFEYSDVDVFFQYHEALKCINIGRKIVKLSQPDELWFTNVMQLSRMQHLSRTRYIFYLP